MNTCRAFIIQNWVLSVLWRQRLNSRVITTVVIVHFGWAQGCRSLFQLTWRPLRDVLKNLTIRKLVNGLHKVLAKHVPTFWLLIAEDYWNFLDLINNRALKREIWLLIVLTVKLGWCKSTHLERWVLNMWLIMFFNGLFLILKTSHIRPNDLILNGKLSLSLLRGTLFTRRILLHLGMLRLFDWRQPLTVSKIKRCVLHYTYFSQK